MVHATIFKQDTPSDDLDSVYFVFERINSGGIKLSPQEIRNCIISSDIYGGKFIDIIKGLNNNAHWRKVLSLPVNKRAKDEELIVRFLAMLENHAHYNRPMFKFLNDYSMSINKTIKAKKSKQEYLENTFVNTITLIHSALGTHAFRPNKLLNAAVLDSVMVGIAIRLSKGDKPDPSAVKAAYDKLLSQPEYLKTCERSTADVENVKARIKASIEAFSVI